MKDTISLTVPMDYNALTRASDMLHGLAQDLSKTVTPKPSSSISDGITTVEEFVKNNTLGEPHIPDADKTGKPDLVEEIEPSATTVFGESPEPTPATPAPIDLDSAGLPWDHRINGKARLKLQKTGTWKYIRGIDPALIDQVEAELRVTMAIPATTPVVIEPTTEQASIITPAAPTQPATAPIVETEVTPAPPVTGMTFPILMGRITAGKITNEVVTAACNKHGVPALPLLAARPDLVPLVAAELGVTA